MRVRDLAWAAGIVEGEGCITLYKSRTNSGMAYVMKITVVNTSLPMLKELLHIFKRGYIGVRRLRSARHKQTWHWEVTTKNAEAVLLALQPYIRTKREQCRLALLSRALINLHGNNRRNKNRKTLDRLLLRMQRLKH